MMISRKHNLALATALLLTPLTLAAANDKPKMETKNE